MTALRTRPALATTVVNPDDPALLGFPPLLPMELALHTASVPEICASYEVTKEEFLVLIEDPLFVQAYAAAKEALARDGMSFKTKAKLQAEKLLEKSWSLIHSDNTPSAVKADLIKSTVRWAGYEPKGDNALGNGSAFQININLGG
jgi:hypothetical protein